MILAQIIGRTLTAIFVPNDVAINHNLTDDADSRTCEDDVIRTYMAQTDEVTG